MTKTEQAHILETPTTNTDPDPQSQLAMTDPDPGTIRGEIEAGLNGIRSPSPRGFLNNFPDTLPGGRLSEGMRRLGRLDELRYHDSTWSEEERSAHSELIIGQTYGQFYKDVAQALYEATEGLIPDERLRFNDPVLTAYALLRHKGYYHRDLW